MSGFRAGAAGGHRATRASPSRTRRTTRSSCSSHTGSTTRGWRSRRPDKRWEAAVWGKNLSDTQYTVSGGDTSGFGTIGLTTNNPAHLRRSRSAGTSDRHGGGDARGWSAPRRRVTWVGLPRRPSSGPNYETAEPARLRPEPAADPRRAPRREVGQPGCGPDKPVAIGDELRPAAGCARCSTTRSSAARASG